MISGIIDPPSIECLKLMKIDGDQSVIPLAIKRQGGQQKFRIPFKNNGSQDVEIDFSFAGPSTSTSDQDLHLEDYFEFTCVPTSLKMAAAQNGVLNLMVRAKKPLPEGTTTTQQKRCIRLMTAKVKDTSTLLFCYIVDA